MNTIKCLFSLQNYCLHDVMLIISDIRLLYAHTMSNQLWAKLHCSFPAFISAPGCNIHEPLWPVQRAHIRSHHQLTSLVICYFFLFLLLLALLFQYFQIEISKCCILSVFQMSYSNKFLFLSIQCVWNLAVFCSDDWWSYFTTWLMITQFLIFHNECGSDVRAQWTVGAVWDREVLQLCLNKVSLLSFHMIISSFHCCAYK